MKIVLTADEGLFTDYGGEWWRGYITCFPLEMIPRSDFERYCPRIASEHHIAPRAPLSLRVIESIIGGECCSPTRVACVDPRDLDAVIGEDTELVCVSVIDPLGLGYITRSVLSHYGGTSYNRFLFRNLMQKLSHLRRSKPFKILVGGPGAWQLDQGELMKDLGIDFLFIGEGEKTLPGLIKEILSGSPSWRSTWMGVEPDDSEIRSISKPSTNGMIEVSRGCSRKCAFCSSSGNRRDLKLGTILQSAKACIDGGSEHLTLQSDDPLAYGSKGDRSNVSKLSEMMEGMQNAGAKSISFLHTTFSSVASDPDGFRGIVSKMGAYAHKNIQVGIETGSPRLVRKHMIGKCRPFTPEEWPDVVRSALNCLVESGFSVWATLILGLPGETEEDVSFTFDLLESLRENPVVFVPLLFFPLDGSALVDKAPYSIRQLEREHIALLRMIRKHNSNKAPPDLLHLLDLLPVSFTHRKMGLDRTDRYPEADHPTIE